MISKDGKNLRVSDLNAGNYACPKGEELLFHVKLENVLFDDRTGERKSHPRVQKFGRKAFVSSILPALKKSGYTVDILHNPDEWLKEHKDVAVKAARRSKPASIDIEKLKAELKAELREEVKAEMKAEMEAPAPSKPRKGKTAPAPEPEPEPAPEPEPEPEPGDPLES